MTPEEVIARLLGSSTLADVKAAFSGALVDNALYHWDCEVERRGETIYVDGRISYNGAVVGEFRRQMYFERTAARAKHVMIEIESAHQGRGIAKEIYRGAFRFYRKVGIRFVHLDADVDGPTIWPQFAFDIERRQDKELLASIMRRQGVTGIPSDVKELFAPDVAMIEGAGEGQMMSRSDSEFLRNCGYGWTGRSACLWTWKMTINRKY